MKNTLQSNENFTRWQSLCNSFVLKNCLVMPIFVRIIEKTAKNLTEKQFLCNRIA